MRDRFQFIVNEQLRCHHDETCVEYIEVTAKPDLLLTKGQQKAVDCTQKK